jgi:hypothetical protein
VSTPFSNWSPNEPSNSGDEDYGHIGLPFGAWNDRVDGGSNEVAGYYVEFETVGVVDHDWSVVATLAAGTTAYQDGTVVSGRSYEYRVVAGGAQADSRPSFVLSVAVP